MKKFLFVLLFAATPTFAFAEATSTATITIRDGTITAFTGTVELATSTTLPVDIAPTNSTTTVTVPANSLLATLIALDATTTDFNITDLAYFSSFNSFLINCIEIPDASTTDCFNWTYAVNGAFPQVGVDHQTLHDADVVYLFFGPPRQTVLSTTTAVIDESFTATAQQYDLQSGSYVGAQGLTIGVGTSNPDFSFTELATSTSGANGEAIFTLNTTGAFAVGIQEDFYFPTASITVTDAPATTTETTPEPPPVQSSGGGGGGSISHYQLNIPAALAYLASKQHADGSFDAPFLTDWASLAFAAQDPGVAKTSLQNYLVSAPLALSSVTDYERHATALLALGINPYSGTSVDYITPIVNAFDGTQIGDVSLDNDDIFALFPLLHAGYNTSDSLIQKTVTFILSRQETSGAWDASVDITAAAIQALTEVDSLLEVSAAIERAKAYLHSQQNPDGGWGNSFSTSWALQAIAALNESPTNWAPSGYNPNDYLAGLQQSDGGIEPTTETSQTRVWATEYAIPASLGKTWASLLQSFPMPVSGSVSDSSDAPAVSTDVATSTPLVATSTPATATSTAPALSITQSTTTVSTTPSRVIKPKIKTLSKTPASTTPQLAAVVSAPASGFFNHLWDTIASFFSFIIKLLL